MYKGVISNMLFLFALSPTLSAEPAPVTKDALSGKWVSNCFYVESSDPQNPDESTYQKVYWDFDSSINSVTVFIYDSSNAKCKGGQIFKTSARYKYTIEGGGKAQGGLLVARVSGEFVDGDEYWDKYYRNIMYIENDRLYGGEDAGEGMHQYPQRIDRSIYFVRY